jgi:23S rRNA (adenine2030-N6)-methyltransferase
MNYRHAFHAGNFADVTKHAVLALVLVHLNRKDTAYRVIDTHAGAGIYDLAGDRAGRTGEWREGIGRILAEPPEPAAAGLLAPYLETVGDLRAEHGGMLYPGSPEIARRLTRRQDRLILVEKHPEEVRALAEAMGRDRRAKVVTLDGWTALKAYVPPVEKRGLVLVDPPFEEPGEFLRMGQAVAEAWRKWRTGLFMLWYPIKREDDADGLDRALSEAGIAKRLRIELVLRPDAGEGRLRGSGLLLVNPPWTLKADAQVLLPFLARRLATGRAGQWRCEASEDLSGAVPSID